LLYYDIECSGTWPNDCSSITENDCSSVNIVEASDEENLVGNEKRGKKDTGINFSGAEIFKKK